MPKEKILYDPRTETGLAKRVLVSDRPDGFRPASGKLGQKIITLLASGPRYPAEIARSLGAHHQTVYYHIGRLEKAGLITRVRSEHIRGGEAKLYALASDGYAVEFPVKGEPLPTLRSSGRSRALGRFFDEFLHDGEFDGWIVVGSPLQHGSAGTQARDGHYAVQLGFALGQFVNLPEKFPVKLDTDLRAEKLTASNLVVVGGPRNNVIAEALNQHLPFKFSQGGFWSAIVDEGGNSHGAELDCLVEKIQNPWDRSKTCVVIAGLTGGGTKAAIIGVCNHADALFSKYRSGPFAALLRGADRDGDGKVDSVEVLRQL
ncbi:MAG: helix-turn-helix domain-containing protein [Nitrososphaerota archaeon]|nr:helix-turn-helix domain-containing protein [Nitrososphaerota archaeon]MCL5672249.1 helix-turn-helix domain-containing protein [Nitrososphaerota archaeon]MDG6903571.1 helix-turn-helix domain-containing protein [Nitrososphaerota archaeon]MDG6912266.1 helix-turn-helix domain-containing protein [Nitrososphaerota archaeon]MDG6924686.1 helix-turn-helix domain-containing protein [Nitrososphaerota archaeon]